MDQLAYESLTGKKLEDKNTNWVSLCPAHDEKSPSFYIHKRTYLCHCFGCGTSGYLDIVLAKLYNCTYEDMRQNLDIPFLKQRMDNRIKSVIEPTFSRAWLSQFRRIEMHPYLRMRGFKSSTVILHSARWDPEGRIVFPLSSLGGPIMGAAGRSIKPSVSPKWYFYWRATKGDILYQPIDSLQLNIIVEGIFDVMWLNQHGYQGAAALLGSTATQRQIELIKQNTNEVTLFLDNDEPGRIGQEKLAKALKGSIKVYYANYPVDTSDPQELTEEDLNHAINNRQTYIEYVQN